MAATVAVVMPYSLHECRTHEVHLLEKVQGLSESYLKSSLPSAVDRCEVQNATQSRIRPMEYICINRIIYS